MTPTFKRSIRIANATTRAKHIFVVLTIVLAAFMFALNLNTASSLPGTRVLVAAPQEVATRSILFQANGQLHIMEVPA